MHIMNSPSEIVKGKLRFWFITVFHCSSINFSAKRIILDRRVRGVNYLREKGIRENNQVFEKT
ncbi:hypothetical protein U27_03581 [Candidatus Vecturithrix granuli]|uniref:Uncharacterized protein n=1 Tax=Vecturithrix granuli TaxID=1499967 RepID=A0A081BWB3_VECG1|nr:hypothetical protein U27_03581 [Candidatus Vecturithrix granuli]